MPIFQRNKKSLTGNSATKPISSSFVGNTDDDEILNSIVGDMVTTDTSQVKQSPGYQPIDPAMKSKLPTTSGNTEGNQNIKPASMNQNIKPMYFSAGPSAQSSIQSPDRTAKPVSALPASNIASNTDSTKQAAIDKARGEARRKLQDQAKNNQREVADGIDYNGDGVIGTGIEGMAGGREMTEEDRIATIIHEMLQPVDNTQARDEFQDQLEAANAENIQAARARSGLAGMGLSGAASAIEGTERRRGAREEALALDEFDRAARAENFQRQLQGISSSQERLAFETSIMLLEDELGMDLNGDGVQGQSGTKEDIKKAEDKAKREKEIQQRNDALPWTPLVGMRDKFISGPWTHSGDGSTYYIYMTENGEKYRSGLAPQS